MAAVTQAWEPTHIKEMVRLYNHKDGYAIKEITYRLNQKCGTERNTGSVTQQLVKVRKDPPKDILGAGKLIKRKGHVQGVLSDEAEAVQSKIDAKHFQANAKRREKKNGVIAAPARNGKVRAATNGKGDPLLATGSRSLNVDLGDKGSIVLTINGAILLNEELVGNLTAAVTAALRV